MADATGPFHGGASPYSMNGYGRTASGYAQGYQARAHHDPAAQPAHTPSHAATPRAAQRSGGVSAAGLSQIAGACVSAALLIGVSVWGYQLIMRDVSGVPVVRAMEGPMRVAPETPGGAQAAHQGLAVNEVAGRGAASGPASELRLAPTPVDLSADDQPSETLQLALIDPELRPEPRPQTLVTPEVPQPAARTAPSVTDAAIQALADQIAADVAPLTGLSPDAVDAATGPEVETRLSDAPTPAVAGAARSLRPQARPGSLVTAALNVPSSAGTGPGPIDVDPSSLPVGTRLVQLGAYDSVDLAAAEWAEVAAQFDTFFEGKRRVIERAESGGRVFYRLRAEGFSDLADARRFCAALVAERADCIPVVTR